MSSLRARAAALAAVAVIGFSTLSAGAAHAAPSSSPAPAPAARAATTPAEVAPEVAEALSALAPPTRIPGNSFLTKDQSWYSPSGRSRVVMQWDGNVVLYRDGKAIWAAPGAIPNGDHLVMQWDGNLVLYAADNRPIWWSHTEGHPGAELTVYNEGAIAVELNGKILWTSAPPAQVPLPCPPWGPPYPGQVIPPWCPVWPFPS
ncbi:hypothetical protein [Kitasatospora sp. NPDC050543]|uniref:hypothetical protein n=1 Tax=Kitasatospora sp. NPDC050543 TaxID=3364054 RepID=UPI00379DCDB3